MERNFNNGKYRERKKHARMSWDKKCHRNLTIKLEEISQKILLTEGRLKRYRDRVKQNKQSRIFENNERKLHKQIG